MPYSLRSALAPLALAAALAVPCATARAQTFSGPTPYLSTADSPFPLAGSTYFYLEDFEDGLLNTPGVTASGGIVLGPGALTDSVDGDDGAIDGLGTRGHSFYSNGATQSITFTFDANVLGDLPTYAGLVWTDVGISAPVLGIDGVTFSATGVGGTALGSVGPVNLGDGTAAGGTAEDRFFGVTFSGGIASITLTMANSADWEMDHLQYGRVAAVPEPGSLALAFGSATSGIWLLLRRRKSGRAKNV